MGDCVQSFRMLPRRHEESVVSLQLQGTAWINQAVCSLWGAGRGCCGLGTCKPTLR